MKRLISIAAVLCLGAAAPVGAAPTATTVLEDPVGDANFINDQGQGDGSFGDHVTPADVSSVTDIMEVTIANDKKNVYVTFVTEAGPPATQGVGYRLRVNPDGAGGSYCLHFEAFYPGGGNVLDQAEAHLRDSCTGEIIEAEVLGAMVVVPRKAHEAFAKKAVLAAPQAQGFIYVGGSYPAGLAQPTTDTTKVGEDYKLVK